MHFVGVRRYPIKGAVDLAKVDALRGRMIDNWIEVSDALVHKYLDSLSVVGQRRLIEVDLVSIDVGTGAE